MLRGSFGLMGSQILAECQRSGDTKGWNQQLQPRRDGQTCEGKLICWPL